MSWCGQLTSWANVDPALCRQLVSLGHNEGDVFPQLKWWHFAHMMTSSNGNSIFRVTGLCAGNSPVTGEFPAQRPVAQSFAVFFDLRLNNGWVSNREAGDLRRHRAHYDVIVMAMMWAHRHDIHAVALHGPCWELTKFWTYHFHELMHMYRRVPLKRDQLKHGIAHNTTMTKAKHKKRNLIKDTPYLAFTGELWCVYHEYLGQNWPR